MGRRDEGLISTSEEALAWLAEYRHTIVDPQVIKVIEALENAETELHEKFSWDEQAAELETQQRQDEIDDLRRELAEARADVASQNDELVDQYETFIDAAEEWASYVLEDNAPRTLIEHLRKAVGEKP